MLSVNSIIIFWQAYPTLARGGENQNAITFRRRPIVLFLGLYQKRMISQNMHMSLII